MPAVTAERGKSGVFDSGMGYHTSPQVGLCRAPDGALGLTGLRLVEGSHAGNDFVALAENGAKTTIDAIGQPGLFANWNKQAGNFFEKLVEHINFKSVDKVAIDLKGASKAQVSQIKAFLGKLSKVEQAKVIYVN